MIWRIVRSRGFIPIVLILAALVYWKMSPGSPKVISVGYVADRDVILWNTLAQVREEVAEVHYGDRVEVMRVEGAAVQVRTPIRHDRVDARFAANDGLRSLGKERRFN